MSNLKVTVIQSDIYWEAPTKNRNKLSEKLQGINQETDLIVLPEMFNSGFSMNAKELAETMNGETLEWMHKKAAEKKAVITGSLIIEEDNPRLARTIGESVLQAAMNPH